jgi:hypothetical protein
MLSNLLVSHLSQGLHMENRPPFHLNHCSCTVYVSFFLEEHFLK